MYVNTTLSPPLGGTTVHTQDSTPIRFTAWIETAESSNKTRNWTVLLWYGIEGASHWEPAQFSEVLEAADDGIHVVNQDVVNSVKHKVFVLDLDYDGYAPLQFTIKFRVADDAPWLWSGKRIGQGDGRIIFESPLSLASTPSLADLFEDIPSHVKHEQKRSQVKDVSIWDITSPVKSETADNITLGFPLRLEQFMSLVRIAIPWMGPHHGKGGYSNNGDALLLGYLRKDGTHVVLLPMSGTKDKCTTYVLSDDRGRVVMKTRNDGKEDGQAHCVVGQGRNFQATIDAVMYRAREILSAERSIALAVDIKPAWMETWVDGLAYCTWNGLGRELSEQRLIDALQDLENSGLRITSLIIDDNWQDLRNRKWFNFEANKRNFPSGLKSTVAKIRTKFPYIQHVACWHALLGYWDGIAPGGWIDKNYHCVDVKYHDGNILRVVDADDVDRFYNDFYKFLSDCGVDAVKADVQCTTSELDSPVDRARLLHPYQDAVKKYSSKYFQGKIIYCMCHVSEVLFYGLLPHDRAPVLCRNSDDFYPEIPDSHAWHVFANTYNNVLVSHLNCLPDWDMFQSSLPEYGSLHAAARCISGGPIYITDTPKQHNTEVLKQLAASSPSGRSLILRPSSVALPVDPYVGYHDNRLLRVGNFNWMPGSGVSLLAIFNISKQTLSELLLWKDFRGSHANVEYVVRAHRTGAVVGGKLRDKNKPFAITLVELSWEIFSAVPVQTITTKVGRVVRICTFGLLTQMSGVAAVVKTSLSEEQSGRVKFVVTLKALGKLGIWVADLDKLDLPDMMISVGGECVPMECVKKTSLIEVDVLTAWLSMDSQSNVANEVNVVLHL